jgi:hypothetical protein
MELGGKLLNSLRIETQFLEGLQSVSDVDGAAHTQNDDVESNGGSLEDVAKVFMLFLWGVVFTASVVFLFSFPQPQQYLFKTLSAVSRTP